MPGDHFHTQQHFNTSNMALHMNEAHIIYHHMDSSWSMGLVQSYFSYPDYLVVHCWAYTAILFLNLINPGYLITPRGPQVHHFIKFFPGGGPHV